MIFFCLLLSFWPLAGSFGSLYSSYTVQLLISIWSLIKKEEKRKEVQVAQWKVLTIAALRLWVQIMLPMEKKKELF